MTSMAETHPQIERGSTDDVEALQQENSAGVHQGIYFESSIVSDFDLDEINLSFLILNLELLLFSGNPSFIGDSCRTCPLIISRFKRQFSTKPARLDSPPSN